MQCELQAQRGFFFLSPPLGRICSCSYACNALLSAFKAAAPEHQDRIVSCADWYQDLDSMFPVFFLIASHVCFPCIQDQHMIPRDESLSCGFRTLRSGACLHGTWTVKPSFMLSFFLLWSAFCSSFCFFAQLKGCF